MPDRLGTPTTIAFAFSISAISGQLLPPALTRIDLLYPRNLGIVNSGLGLDTCTTTTLELTGPKGCPADSRLGEGTAQVKIPFGPDIVQETGAITIYMAPPQQGHISLIFYAEGESPVAAELAFPSLLLPAPTRYGGTIRVNIPPIPGVSEGPDAAITHLQSTIGPLGLTYYEHRHGELVPYSPKGIILPDSCPHSGFPFAATFAFIDGSHAVARTSVPCPR